MRTNTLYDIISFSFVDAIYVLIQIFVAELSGQNINLDFQTLYIGSTGTEKLPPQLTSTTTSNKEVPNFVGHMQHFIFNGQHFFDMARSGQMTNFKVMYSILY